MTSVLGAAGVFAGSAFLRSLPAAPVFLVTRVAAPLKERVDWAPLAGGAPRVRRVVAGMVVVGVGIWRGALACRWDGSYVAMDAGGEDTGSMQM